MGLQKYRADIAGEKRNNGSIPYYANWIGGPTLSLIRNCPTPFGPRTVYITGEPDSFFSVPAACRCKGKNVRGCIMIDRDGNYEFRPFKKAALEEIAVGV